MLEILAGAMLALSAIALVLEPLFRGPRVVQMDSIGDVDWSDLDESDTPKVKALRALKEIEFDHETGKLSDDDFERLRSKYAAEALTAIKEEKKEVERPPGYDIEDEVERIVRAAKERTGTDCPVCSAALEPGAAFCSACGCSLVSEAPKPRCWTCGSDISKGDQFCPGCGANLLEAASS